jgi:3'(2'), 5'-bisphosphate nucleotidase
LGAALKFCAIAEGKAEISYRLSQGTKEWDIAAGTIILKEAGGLILKPDGSEYAFNREDVYNREGYMLMNRKENWLL